MTVYAIAQIRIHDRARYQRYVAGFMPILVKGKMAARRLEQVVVEPAGGAHAARDRIRPRRRRARAAPG